MSYTRHIFLVTFVMNIFFMPRIRSFFSVLHYRIKKLSSGEVGLCGVPRQKFAGPVELVQGVEGLACKPVLPCNKSLDSVLPLTHWGVTEETIRKAILKKAKEWGIDVSIL